MPRLMLWIALFCATFSAIARADTPVVVELFTSQGCSSCPPADAMLRELAGRDDVIALALHVDYWDYIGWADSFADPAHAKRQRAYAKASGRKSIYTPQLIVNGETDIVGAKPMKLGKAIMDHAQKPAAVTLGLRREGGALSISAPVPSGQAGPFVVHMLRVTPERTVQITRGENAGRTLAYSNIVEGWTVLGTWDGRAPLDLQAEVAGDLPVVVLVQSAPVGAIHGAAILR